MKQKITITESRLREIVKEAVISELSSDFVRDVYDNLDSRKLPGEEDLPLHRVNKLQRSNGRTDDRGRVARELSDYMRRAKRKEINQAPLAQEALRIWNEANLENDIEWEDSDWITSGDETYGPCQGYVEYEGWQFEIYGYQDNQYDHEIDESEPIDFETPDGKRGSFYLIR